MPKKRLLRTKKRKCYKDVGCDHNIFIDTNVPCFIRDYDLTKEEKKIIPATNGRGLIKHCSPPFVLDNGDVACYAEFFDEPDQDYIIEYQNAWTADIEVRNHFRKYGIGADGILMIDDTKADDELMDMNNDNNNIQINNDNNKSRKQSKKLKKLKKKIKINKMKRQKKSKQVKELQV